MRIDGFLQRLFQFPVKVNLLSSPKKHPPTFTLTRGVLIVDRIRQISTLFALLTLCFIAVDVSFLPEPVWQHLAFNRGFTSLAFIVLALSCSQPTGVLKVYCRLFLLFAIPIVFLLNTNHVLNYTHNAKELVLISAYSCSSFVIASGISLFPLAMTEAVLLLALPIILAMSASVLTFPDMLVLNSGFSIIWVLLLILCTSVLSAISQLGFMLRLFDDTAHDSLTGLFNRKVGEDILNQQFQVALRQKSAFAMLFIDLDHFKRINDLFGHDAGDGVLKGVSDHLRKVLRRQDIAIRWGGEEFLIALPNTNITHTKEFISRLVSEGFGLCPDGGLVTASIGVAECRADNLYDWESLTKLADKRMYTAKQAGRNCYVLQDEAYPY